VGFRISPWDASPLSSTLTGRPINLLVGPGRVPTVTLE
jgi:hypothetical protein